VDGVFEWRNNGGRLMNNKRILQNKPAYDFFLGSRNIVDDLCCNLKKHRVLNFSYIRLWNDGSYIDLSNHDIVFSSKYFFDISKIDHQSISRFQNMSVNKKEFMVWPQNSYDPVFSLMHEYNYRNGISMLSKQKDYVELLKLCPIISDNATLINNVINNKDLYIAITNKFVGDATSIINKWTTDKKATFADHISLEQCKKFPEKDTKPGSNVIIKIYNNDIRFTCREASCMAYLMKGFSAQQIGYYLGIFSRTVEQHLNNIKLKSGLRYNSELREFLHISSEARFVLESIY